MPNSPPVAAAPTAERLPTVAYRDLVDEKFARVDEKFGRVWDRFTAVERAIDKAEESLSSYKQMANEFRGTLSDQALRLSTKDDMTQTRDMIERQRLRIDKIENDGSNMQGRIWMLAAVFAVLQIVINIAQRFLATAG